MHFVDFEKLKFEPNDRMWVQDEKGEGHWGWFKGEYNCSDKTFKFHNVGTGQDQIISIDKMQRITR